jgi:hypothetical protein
MPPLAGIIGAGAMTMVIAQTSADPAGVLVSADEIARVVVGKTCTTKAGAKFTFSDDGHYEYDGLWANSGHYFVHDGAVTVLLDSGLEREFAIVRKGDVVYMEQTALSCK